MNLMYCIRYTDGIRCLKFNPKEDITPFELALIIQWMYQDRNWNPTPPINCLRHFD